MPWWKLPTVEKITFLPGMMVALKKVGDFQLRLAETLYAAPGNPTRRERQLKLNYEIGKFTAGEVAIVINSTLPNAPENGTAIMTSQGSMGWISTSLLEEC